MGLTIADTYYLRAKGASCGFFSDWQEVCETLNYALSYDENHCASLCLLGEIYAEQMQQYDNAFECFDKVLTIDPNNSEVYPKYATYLIWINEVERAEKLVNHAFSINSINKAQLLWLLSYINETKGNYKKSLKHLKQAKINCHNDRYYDFMHNEQKRINKKVDTLKPKKKTKKNKSKNIKNKKKKK